jgi:hypothetical protein
VFRSRIDVKIMLYFMMGYFFNLFTFCIHRNRPVSVKAEMSVFMALLPLRGVARTPWSTDLQSSGINRIFLHHRPVSTLNTHLLSSGQRDTLLSGVITQ